jgi:predicted AlkP superfamily phosphohydrolase/phosphomutase
MPNFSKLRERGIYRRLATTNPPLSPVAWSTFSTGVGPGRHRIFDFLHRNPNTYLPELSSSRINEPKRYLNIGRYRFPLQKPKYQFLRRSQSFWSLLSKRGIFSHILRVPLTFPPEKVYGVLLSAMCAPDLRGTQGSFTYYSSQKDEEEKYTGGIFSPLTQDQDTCKGKLIGPDHPYLKKRTPLTVPFCIKIDEDPTKVIFYVQGDAHQLTLNQLSPWIRVHFKLGLGIRVSGVFQCCLKSIQPYMALYISPIHIDPYKPALPISYPSYYASYLARLFGKPYATLGLSEDTWALNEGILKDKDFWDQVCGIHQTREDHLLYTLKKMGKGLCVYVFDATDRIQHMFFRHTVPDHPANKNADPSPMTDAIHQIYIRADETLGKAMEMISDEAFLLVLSDHGFKPFICGVNLNSWLHQNGYLTLKNNNLDSEYLQNVDWSKTRAYAIGLAGIYINLKNREKHGIVESGKESREIKQRISRELTGLRDEKRNQSAVRRVFDTEKIYTGPYKGEAPDLLVGYQIGYRISWDGALGKVTKTVFEDNEKNWSGDHGIDPEQVPGILFSNSKIADENPGIIDIAPTLLNLFGIRPPSYMEGKVLRITKKQEDLKTK